MTRRVAVVGSANVDLVVDVPHHPRPGETVLGGDVRRTCGGKGANQAVAAARAGGVDTTFIGAVGVDDGARLLVSSLDGAGVQTDLVARSEAGTGQAFITVAPDGENSIVVAPGANSQVTIGPAETARIADADVVLAQLEVPLDVIRDAMTARRSDALMVLNAAPSQALSDDLWDGVDVLVVNETEAVDLAGEATDRGDPRGLVASLLTRVDAVVLTLGSQGSLVAQRGEEPVEIPPFAVDAVDTTGAGDTFCGVLAAELARGSELPAAATQAAAAGALAVTRSGAQEAVPTRSEITAFVVG